MKKVLATVLALSMTTAVFAGCTSTADKTEDVDTGSSEEISDTAPAAAIDADRIKTIHDYYEANKLRENFAIQTYSDDVTGSLFYFGESEQALYIGYHSDTLYGQESRLEMHINVDSNTVSLSIDVIYSNEETDNGCPRYNASINSVSPDSVGKFFTEFDASKFSNVFENSAAGKPELKSDVLTMYARFLALSDKALAKIPGIGTLDDIGLDLDRPANADPKALLTWEFADLVNEHVFENGKCKDCGMTWGEYLLECAPTFDVNSDPDSPYISFYGRNSEYVLPGCYVQYTFSETSKNIYYHVSSPKTDSPLDFTGSFTASPDKGNGLHITYVLEDHENICYWCELDVAPGELAEVLASEELFKASCTVDAFVFDKDGNQTYVDESTPAQEIADMEAQNGFKIFSFDEVRGYFYDYAAICLCAVDKSLAPFGTSLKDAGVDIDKIYG